MSNNKKPPQKNPLRQIAFHSAHFCPFLPVTIVCLWWIPWHLLVEFQFGLMKWASMLFTLEAKKSQQCLQAWLQFPSVRRPCKSTMHANFFFLQNAQKYEINSLFSPHFSGKELRHVKRLQSPIIWTSTCSESTGIVSKGKTHGSIITQVPLTLFTAFVKAQPWSRKKVLMSVGRGIVWLAKSYMKVT